MPGSLLAIASAALLALAAGQPQPRLRPPFDTAPDPAPPQSATRLPARPPVSEQPLPERVPIDLGPDAPTAEPPQQIDILAPPQTSEAANAAELKECADQTERGIVSGEIVVCRELPADTSQLYSGSHEAWEKAYAERTMNAGTLPTPDVAGPGIFRGEPTISGLCIIGPCPKDPALMIDVEAIETPPAGSDAERVAQGMAPVESDDAPLSDDARQRIAAELGLPETSKPSDEVPAEAPASSPLP